MRKKKPKKESEEAPAQPPEDFLNWWNPTGTDKVSGASIGGHCDAERVWARKDPGKWTRRSYGINAVFAWQALPYLMEYRAWVSAGRPDDEQPFVSLAMPLAEQVAKWREINEKIMATIKAKAKALTEAKAEEMARRKLLQEQKVALLHDKTQVIDAEEIKFNGTEAND